MRCSRLADAVLCAPGRVTDLARLSLVPEFGRGHGALYDALNAGGWSSRGCGGRWRGCRCRPGRTGGSGWRWTCPAGCGRTRQASPERMFCHVHGRGAERRGRWIPGWPYSFVAALGPGASSWTLLLDAVRLGPGDDAADVTAAQLREVAARLIAAGRWQAGRPGHHHRDGRRLRPGAAGLAAAGPAGPSLGALVRSDRVLLPAGAARDPRVPGRRARPRRPGQVRATRQRRRGRGGASAGDQARHGPAAVTAWHRMHPRLITGARGGWSRTGPPGEELPVVEGTLIRLAAVRPGPGYPAGEPMWLWASDPAPARSARPGCGRPTCAASTSSTCFRFLKQQLGWTGPLLRDPAAADRWTWLLHRRLGPALARPPARRRHPPALAAAPPRPPR